jgi:hypothetical protein
MAVADDGPSNADPNLASREPTLEDLRDLCRALNERGARYVVIGGFAIRAAGYNRRTICAALESIDYAAAATDTVVTEVDGVPIPFASPRLLWRMKAITHREKAAGDLVFLRYWFAERGEVPPGS